MKNDDMPEFLNLMTGIGSLYGKPINEPLIEIYWRALERFDFPAVKDALQVHINNPDAGQYFPKPADVVRYLEGSTRTQGLQAWSRVLKSIRQVGSYDTVIFDDPIVHAVIEDMGGWLELCKITEEETPFKANEFEKRYAAYVLHPPEIYPRQLTGIFESNNSHRGFDVAPPVLIGDQKKALLVYQSGSDGALLCHQPSVPISQLVKQLAAPKTTQSNPEEQNP